MSEFDDLIPGGPKRGKPAPKAQGSDPFADLIPKGGAKPRPQAQAPKPRKVTDDMNLFERVAAGVGQSFDSAYHGLVDAPAESVNSHLALADRGLRAIGADGAANWVNRNVGAPVARRVTEQRKAEQGRREMDADLLSTGAGRTGQVVGTVAQFLGPGAVAKGASAVPQFSRAAPALAATGRTLLPTSVRGNVALGGAAGLVQPVANDAERMQNTTMGAGFGGAGAALPRLIGGTVRAGRAASERLTRAGAQRRAVREVQAEATNPPALMRPQPSHVPGVSRSLFEESLDPGVARMETRSRGNAGGWAERDKVNNAARVNAIRGFAGDEGSIAQAAGVRDRATGPLYKQARDAGALGDTSALQSKLGTLATQMKGREGVQQTLSKLQQMVADSANTNELMNVRDTITDMLAGKYAGDAGKALVGNKMLMQAKAEVERSIGLVAPTYRTAQREFRDLSRPINRMEVGQRVLRDSTGNVIDDLGHYTLSPDKFGRAMKNLDGVAGAATGFRKAKAGNILEPQDMATLGAVNDDLSRQAQRLQYGAGGNSHTASQAELAARVAERATTRFMPAVVGDLMNSLEQAGQGRLNDALAYVLQNPQEYRRIAASLPPAEAQAFELALSRIGGRAGAIIPTLVERGGE